MASVGGSPATPAYAAPPGIELASAPGEMSCGAARARASTAVQPANVPRTPTRRSPSDGGRLGRSGGVLDTFTAPLSSSSCSARYTPSVASRIPSDRPGTERSCASAASSSQGSRPWRRGRASRLRNRLGVRGTEQGRRDAADVPDGDGAMVVAGAEQYVTEPEQMRSNI